MTTGTPAPANGVRVSKKLPDKGTRDWEWLLTFHQEMQSMRAQLDRQSVIKANAQFWEQMLAMSLESLPPESIASSEEFSFPPGHLLGTVSLVGVWKGRIDVRMASGLAYEATAAMMMQPLPTVSELDALDATK